MADDLGYTPGSGATVATDEVGGRHYQRIKIAHGVDGAASDVSRANPFPVFPDSLPKVLGVSGNLAVTTAAVLDEWVLWPVPSGYLWKPKVCRSAQASAGSRCVIGAAKHLATFSFLLNTFTDQGSVAAPDFFDRLFARVTTQTAVQANTLTATYVNQDGTGGRSATSPSLASGSPVGNWYEFALQAGDYGVRDITAVSDSSATATGDVELWGVRTLHEVIGATNSSDVTQLGEGLAVPNGESVVVLLHAASTTAQQRAAHAVGDLVAV